MLKRSKKNAEGKVTPQGHRTEVIHKQNVIIFLLTAVLQAEFHKIPSFLPRFFYTDSSFLSLFP